MSARKLRCILVGNMVVGMIGQATVIATTKG